MLRKLIWICSFVLVNRCQAQNYLHLDTPLWFQWPSTAKEAADLKLTNKDVLTILNNIYGDNAAPLYAVQTFTFAQLEPGKLYLIAAVDGSGRELFYGTDIAYCKSPDLCAQQGIYDAPPHNYSEELVDLDGNGAKELIAKELAGGYEGGSSVNIYTYKIYKVIDGRAVDVSLQYKAYYESTLLPKMKAGLSRDLAGLPAGGNREIIEALGTLAEDDYARRILKQPTAGLEHAKTWAHSGNHRLQDYALNTLHEIDDPAADAFLAELSKSGDERMAGAAVREIAIRKSVRENDRLKQTMQSQKQ